MRATKLKQKDWRWMLGKKHEIENAQATSFN